VRDGESGYVVDGRDVAAIIERVSILLGDPTKAAHIGEAGRQFIEAQWQSRLPQQRLERPRDPS
jgi:phosphatidylinositol alpha-1,6-mannosyltransferase